MAYLSTFLFLAGFVLALLCIKELRGSKRPERVRLLATFAGLGAFLAVASNFLAHR